MQLNLSLVVLFGLRRALTLEGLAYTKPSKGPFFVSKSPDSLMAALPSIQGLSFLSTEFHMIDPDQLKIEEVGSPTPVRKSSPCLVQSVSSTIPRYTMQSTKIPQGLCDDIDRANRNFLLGGDNEHRKLHILSWEKVCQDKERGDESHSTAKGRR